MDVDFVHLRSVRFVLSILTAVLLAIKQKSHIRQLINGGCWWRTAGGQGRTTLVDILSSVSQSSYSQLRSFSVCDILSSVSSCTHKLCHLDSVFHTACVSFWDVFHVGVKRQFLAETERRSLRYHFPQRKFAWFVKVTTTVMKLWWWWWWWWWWCWWNCWKLSRSRGAVTLTILLSCHCRPTLCNDTITKCHKCYN